jgi:hypothetical protein
MDEIREGRGVIKVLRQVGCAHTQEEKMSRKGLEINVPRNLYEYKQLVSLPGHW